ncbi:MAG: NAD-dependent epimerase/dehydratase family protein [Anaerolineales bacterium]|jgi:nucleoside-diphosphate-sugar epimerase
MKVLIIGGTGIISTAITRELLARGEDVTLYNRGITPSLIPEGAKRIFGNRREYTNFERQMAEGEPFDCVIDMMCFIPEDAESLVRAFAGRIRQLIFCSTVEVYTKPAERLPIREDNQRASICSYGVNKATCEDILWQAHQRQDFQTTIFRPAYTYGEGGTLIYALGDQTYMDRIAKGGPIVVPGDGNCLWVTCHRDDVGLAFVSAIGNPKAYGKAYNTSGDNWMTWNAYHQTVARAIGAPEPKLVHIPSSLLKKVAPNRYKPRAYIFSHSYIFDNTAAKKDLDFRCTIPWEQGARRTYTWAKDNGRLGNSDEDTFHADLVVAWEGLGEALIAQAKGG